MDRLFKANILVIGAGGLGCEILKNLAMSGFSTIHILDMDSIELSNLNRQFLFRNSHIGMSKAHVAAQAIQNRLKSLNITPHNCRVEDLPPNFFAQFDLIICALDTIQARRYVNATLFTLVDEADPTTYKPIIDGGCEGFKGQVKVIIPCITSCIECHLDLYASQNTLPLCTLAHTPRQPEHCIQWAHLVAWDNERKDEPFNLYNPEHVNWLYHKALQKSKQYNLPGLTYSLTLSVLKNTLPAIASTNSVIAAECTNEAFKLLTNKRPHLGLPHNPNSNTYMMYTADEGVYTYTFRPERKSDCPVCGHLPKSLTISPSQTLADLLHHIFHKPIAQLQRISLQTSSKILYFSSPQSLQRQTHHNLNLTLSKLIHPSEEISVYDGQSGITQKYIINFTPQ